MEPARILDTRLRVGGIPGPLAAETEVFVQVAGQGGVPLHGASAFVLSVTVTEPASAGWLSDDPGRVRCTRRPPRMW